MKALKRGIKALNNSQPVSKCKHITARGNVCHRTALHGNDLCYVHLHDIPDDYCKTNLELPAIENPASIQLAENQVLTAFSAGEITRRDASLFLYGLQIARQNAKHRQNVENGRQKKRAE